MEKPRDQAARIQSDLQKSSSPEVDAVRKMLQAKYEDAKERLVEAMGADVERVQGEARTYKKLLGDISWKQPREGGPA